MEAERPTEEASESAGKAGRPPLPLLALTALGVVFGDLATSPLYSLQTAFGDQGIAPRHDDILGLLSLVLWALLLVVTGKYVCFVMRADNDGEGGMMALTALARGAVKHGRRVRRVVVMAGLLGVALFFGDSVITPAISVLSAIEGLHLAAPGLKHYELPIAVVILIALFVLEKRGSALVGSLFGPVMGLWLLSIAALGVYAIIHRPEVFAAISPQYAVLYLLHNGFRGFASLGAVVLVLTGAEALYADIGHFGTGPIRLAWLGLALPALVLNYFGQGALLLDQPQAAGNPFYHMVPHMLLYPMILLAACATVIASQAVISGTYSMVRQGIQLGFLPRARVLHTSPGVEGQIYMPTINVLLLIAVLGAALGFRSAQHLAGAYGIAVSGTMLLTTLLMLVVARFRWKWGLARLVAFAAVFVVIDAAFVSANMLKIVDGGWFPLVLAAVAMLLMTTWWRGRILLQAQIHAEGEKLDEFVARLHADPPPQRVQATAVFLTGDTRWVPQALLHNVRCNQVLHERNLILHVEGLDTPRANEREACKLEQLGDSFWRVEMRFGFAEEPDVPARLAKLGLDPTAEPDKLVYFLGRDEVVADDKRKMMHWRKALFAYFVRNATPATTYFHIPPRQLVEIGARVEF